MLHISVMTEDDIPFAVSMTDIERWGYLPDDFRRLIDFEPEGCFVARVNGDRAALITSTTYGDFGFMGTLIVRERHRQRGIGETLMRHTMDYLVNRGCRTIELDGVFPAVSLYRRLGFRDKHLSLRFRRLPSAAQPPGDPKPLPSEDALTAFDARCTGLDRSRILHRYLRDFGDALHTCSGNDLEAYAFVRPRAGSGGYFAIGPLVAAGDEAAETVLCDIIDQRGTWPIVMGVPESNRGAVALALRHGFQYTQPSLRMYSGEYLDYEGSIYSIGSAEKG